MLGTAELPYVDVTPVFLSHYRDPKASKLYFSIDRHMNKLGHLLVASAVQDYLQAYEGATTPLAAGEKQMDRSRSIYRPDVHARDHED